MSDAANKPVIFLAFANDRGSGTGKPLNLPEEERRLREALEAGKSLCEVVVRSNSTADDVFKVFQDPQYRNRIAIFHYGGHANAYQLLLESREGKAAAADAGGLADFLAQQQGLHLVFLNGCSTQQQTHGLLDAKIPAVIATSRAIDDQVATDFSVRFYYALARGANLRTAYNEASASIQMTKGGDLRALYYGNTDEPEDHRGERGVPWSIYQREGSETADRWNLPEAVNDPLFGLPPLPEQNLPESPYRHLNWFTRKDAEVFFGRGHQIRELYDRLTAPRTAPIMLFYGQSGVGKSSILDAGLIPRLERDNEVRYLRRGEGGLLDTLQLAFLPEGSGVPIETAWRVKEEQTGKPLIVFLDQVEELYTRPIADMPDELDELLRVANATFSDPNCRPQGKLVLGFRKEWLAELEAKLVDYELPRTKEFLEPLDRRGIIRVVQGPAQSERLSECYGLTIEDGLAEIIADDLLYDRGSAIAPTLQILLTKMWAEATQANYEHPHFSQELYENLKRDGILMRDFLNQQIAKFREKYPEAVDSGLLLDIVALHTTPLGTADQRTIDELQQQYAHLGATLPDLIQQCQDLHLLTVTANAQKESTKTTRLAHDTLAPLVREQFDVSDKPGQRARRILDNRSVDWAEGREGTPLDEADLIIVEQGVSGTRYWNADEDRLVVASRQARERRVQQKREQEQREQELKQAVVDEQRTRAEQAEKSARRIRRTLYVTCLLAVVAAIVALYAFQANQNTAIALGKVQTTSDLAKRTVADLLDHYLGLPRLASHIAAAETIEGAEKAYEELENDGLPASLRVTSPEIAQAVLAIRESLKPWQSYKGPLEVSDGDHPATACRGAVLEMVRVTKKVCESRPARKDEPPNELERRRKLERAIFTKELCERASLVTRQIADAAPDQKEMRKSRFEFERLYWAELYWVELEEHRLLGNSPLEFAMVRFRRDGLKEWKLDEIDEISKTKLGELANEVSKRCDALLSRSTEVGVPGKASQQ